MATGLKAFRRVQLGSEATPGTAVAATRIMLPDSFTVDHSVLFHEPMQERLSLSKLHRSQVKGLPPVPIKYNGDLTFEEIVFWLEGAARGGIAPTQPEVGTDLYTITPLYTATNALETFTLEWGDNEQAFESEYCFVESLDISWGTDEPAKCNVNLLGRQITATTFTGSLTAPTVETVLGNEMQLFVDTAWSGIGGTEVADIVVEGKIKINSGLVAAKRATGDNFFTKTGEGVRQLIECELTMDHDATSKAYRALFQADTRRFFEIRFTGSNIETTYDRFLKIQFCGAFRSFGEGDDDEINTRTIRLESQYDATGSAEAKFLVQNALNAVTEF